MHLLIYDYIMKTILSLIVLLTVNTGVAMGNEKVIVETIAYESGGECFEGQILVAKCILNRIKLRQQTAEQVCYAKYQFSCYNGGKNPRKLTKKELESAEQALDIALTCCNSPVTHYCRTDIANMTYWTKSPKMRFLCDCGAHSFYQEVR